MTGNSVTCLIRDCGVSGVLDKLVGNNIFRGAHD